MTTYPLNKPSYFLFKTLLQMNMSKMQISVLGVIHIMLPFYLILTRGPIIIVKNYLSVIFKLKMLFKEAFRCMFY